MTTPQKTPTTTTHQPNKQTTTNAYVQSATVVLLKPNIYREKNYTGRGILIKTEAM